MLKAHGQKQSLLDLVMVSLMTSEQPGEITSGWLASQSASLEGKGLVLAPQSADTKEQSQEAFVYFKMNDERTPANATTCAC